MRWEGFLQREENRWPHRKLTSSFQQKRRASRHLIHSLLQFKAGGFKITLKMTGETGNTVTAEVGGHFPYQKRSGSVKTLPFYK